MRSVLLTTLIAIAAIAAFGVYAFRSPTHIKETLTPLSGTHEKRGDTNEVVGYLPYWMLVNAEFLRYEALTEIAYFGLHVNEDGSFKKRNEDGTSELGWLHWNTNEQLQGVIRNAKRHNVDMALTIVMQDNDTIELFLECPSCWDTFIENTIAELHNKDVENLHIDVEYSGIAPRSVRNGFTSFAERTTKRVHEEIPSSKVTIDTFANAAHFQRIHDIQALSEFADRLFVMSYDFHKLADDITGPLAPINGAPNPYSYDLTTMVSEYKRFANPEQLILGVPYYGHFWITEDDSLGSYRIPGNDTHGYSTIEFYAGCRYHEENTVENRRWDEIGQTPWFTFFDEETSVYRQCHYEDDRSLTAKYDFAKEHGFAGVGMWALGYDGDKGELWDVLEEAF